VAMQVDYITTTLKKVNYFMALICSYGIEPWWSSFPFTFWKSILLMVFLSHYLCLPNPKNEPWWSPYPFSSVLQILNMNFKHCYSIWNLNFANIQWHLLCFCCMWSTDSGFLYNIHLVLRLAYVLPFMDNIQSLMNCLEGGISSYMIS
jgi:hypothetical protein